MSEKHDGKMIEIAKRSEATVLITGPTGAGKSRLAREIHDAGPRKGKPFIAVNLATLHEGTLESELFGHERGAFTGADRRRVGRLESAQGGTVFLDEIGELSPRFQARLLEVLQSRTIVPVGGSREIQLDIRVIAATHRDLSRAVARGEFREDLLHRLRVISVDLKPIRERWQDFDSIVHSSLETLCRRAGRSVLRISEEVAEMLENYEWPGNFRELNNVLEYAVLAGDGPQITAADLPTWFAQKSGFSAAEEAQNADVLGCLEVPLALDYHQAHAFFEKSYLDWALRRYGGRINRTAQRIGLNKTTLLRRIQTYGLKEALVADLGLID